MHIYKVTVKAETADVPPGGAADATTVADAAADAATGIPTENQQVADAPAITAINANIGKADPIVASEVAMASDDAKGASDAAPLGAVSTAEISGATTGNRDLAVTTISDDVNGSRPIKDQFIALNSESDAGKRFRMLYSNE